MTDGLPKGWENPSLGDISRINPALDRDVEGEDPDMTFVPMRAVEPEGGGLLRPEARRLKDVRRGYTSFVSGDVIMAKITPCMENGKTTVVPEVPSRICFGSTEFHVVRPENGVHARWIAQFLLQRKTRRAAQRQMTGAVGQMRVPASFVASVRIPLPPSAEQERIADALDELFSDLDSAVAGLKRAREKLKVYRASLLKAAVQGDLTADWRANHSNAEPASELLERIRADRRGRWEEDQLANFRAKGKAPTKNWKAKYSEPAAADLLNLPGPPDRWTWATVAQLAAPDKNALTDGPFGSELKTSHYTATGPRVIRLQNIKEGYFSNERAHIDTDRFTRLAKHRVYAGDIVIAALGENPPRACIVPESLGPAIVKADCIRFKTHPALNAGCITAFLNSTPTRLRTKRGVHGVGRPRLNLDEIRSIVVPVPPPAEQDVIAETLDDQFSIIDHLESDLEAKLTESGALRQSILRHAFEGKLVAQDPADEPATCLLKRIAAERETGARDIVTSKRARPKPPSRRERHETFISDHN